MEEYQWDNTLDKIIPNDEENYLEEIDIHLIQHTNEFTVRNIYYKDKDHGRYAINIGSFDITEVLGRPRTIGDGNESLKKTILKKGSSEREREN